MRIHTNPETGKTSECKAKNKCRFEEKQNKETENLSEIKSKKANYIFNKAVEGISGSGARQGHGILFQNRIIDKFLLKEEPGNTALFDGRSESGIAVSIKLSRFGSNYGLGDIFRQSVINEPFVIIAGGWEKDRLNPEYESYYYINDLEKWRSNFNKTLLDEYRELMKRIGNSKEEDEIWNKEIKSLRDKWINSFNEDCLIKPAPKRDHGSQMRIQCVANPKILDKMYAINEQELRELFKNGKN